MAGHYLCPPSKHMPRTRLQQILTQAMQVSGVSRGNIQVLDQQERSLRIVVHHGFDADFLDHFSTVRLFDSTPCGRAAALALPVQVYDVFADRSYASHYTVAREQGYRSVISMPILVDGEAVGVLSVHDSKARAHWPLQGLEACAQAAVEHLAGAALR